MTDLQGVFDRVARHLLIQREPSKRKFQGRPICAYRGNFGRRCAVGVLIADAAYTVELESRGLQCPSVKFALENSGVDLDDHTSRMLDLLQELHDEISVCQWRSRLAEIADAFGLSGVAIIDAEGCGL